MADKSLPQLNSLPSALLNTDLFHVARSAVDYKLDYNALLASLNADLSTLPTSDQKDALDNSNTPNASNPFATVNDLFLIRLQDVLSANPSTNNLDIRSPNARAKLFAIDTEAKIRFIVASTTAETFCNVTSSRISWTNGIDSGYFDASASSSEISHTVEVNLNAPSIKKNGAEIATEAYADSVVNVNTIGAAINGASSATPNDTDLVMSVESSVAKKNTWTQVKAFLKTYFDTVYQAILTAANFGDFLIALTGKTTPVDADSIVISDSAAGDDAKKVSLTNFKAFLKTYFDTIYIPKGQSGTIVFTHTALTFLDSTSYYFANMASLAGTSSSSLRKKPLGITGFAYKFVIKVVCNTAAGTAEDCVLTFRDVTAGTSVVLKTNLHFDANNEYVVTPASPFAIVDINSCECQIDIPLMATNPQGAYLQVAVIMSN